MFPQEVSNQRMHLWACQGLHVLQLARVAAAPSTSHCLLDSSALALVGAESLGSCSDAVVEPFLESIRVVRSKFYVMSRYLTIERASCFQQPCVCRAKSCFCKHIVLERCVLMSPDAFYQKHHLYQEKMHFAASQGKSFQKLEHACIATQLGKSLGSTNNDKR